MEIYNIGNANYDDIFFFLGLNNLDFFLDTVPANMAASQATLEFLGFHEVAAAEYWGKWTEMAPSGENDTEFHRGGQSLIDFATFLIRDMSGYLHKSDSKEIWHQHMDICGISKEHQNRIVYESQDSLGEACGFWIIHHFLKQYGSLKAARSAAK